MEWTILGAGTGIPMLDRGAPGHLMKIKDEQVLFDSGSGTLLRLLQLGVDYKQLNYVFYTHTHSDHTADLIPLIQALRTTPEYQRANTLHLYGPTGFNVFLHTLSQAFGLWLISPNFPLRIHELRYDTLEFAGWSVRTIPVKHSQSAIAYRVESESGRSIVYSGDTDYCPEIIELAYQADLLILECSFPDDAKVAGHLTPSLAAEIASSAQCKHLILTHLYPPIEPLEAEIQQRCHRIFSCRISIARDLMKITVEP
ncbi:MAG: MBL fold metallo-hydrolase [candidate division KSB1 bacterium]|nr:MBL fold metallo-hydrolase [candidate division KSB1 bacterium]